jgi:hypothetical protein
MVIAGLTLLLIVDVRGVAFYVAWSLIVLALVSEAAATLVYWRRSRSGRPLKKSGTPGAAVDTSPDRPPNTRKYVCTP